MNDPVSRPGHRPSAFDAAFARLQVRIESACVTETEWPRQVAAGIRAALEFAALEPGAARTLTTSALSGGRAGYERYDRMVSHLGERLAPGRELSLEGSRLPQIIEKAMVGGVAMLVAQRVDLGRHLELPALADEAIQFILTPYLGRDEARRVAMAA
ncbi:MAG TPA: hypothetical protein VN752_01300 [Solirubrobacterales bacterium]|nr:hypothetical protein [Solirubrobacterales bacterium]